MNAEIDISNVILKTERLTLRPWRQTDLNDFYAYASVDGVGQMAGWKPHENVEESAYRLNKFIAEKRTFALDLNGKCIGSLGVELYNEERFPEFADKKCRQIGFVLSKDYWGQGLMPEAVKAVVGYLFNDVGLDVILCSHYVWNKRSQRVQEKCGFKKYALSKHETKFGTVEDSQENVLTKEVWLSEIRGK
ncbi:MAG: GNAT family N-acetyltransferase [Clostridia bacterium]|nr:GNAT family N-acetyltransferase [Clostridia bacterium]